jgi:hypothetical protein
MTHPLEYAAKALYDHYGDPGDKFYFGEWETGLMAVLAAIRNSNPTPEMIAAGAKKVRGGSASDCAAATWRAMIDELLTERKSG